MSRKKRRSVGSNGSTRKVEQPGKTDEPKREIDPARYSTPHPPAKKPALLLVSAGLLGCWQVFLLVAALFG